MPRKKKAREREPEPAAVVPEIVEEGEDEITPETLQNEVSAGSAIASEVEILPAERPDDYLALEEEAGLPGEAEAKKPTRDIVPYDALTAYLREIQRYPRLSREQEQELAVKYFVKRDMEAAYKLISSNLWLVVKIARDYEKAARSILDLIQEGNIGLMEAVKNFDPYRGVRFPSYAVWWIKAYIVRYVIANWRLVKIGTTQAQRKLFFNLKKEKEKLEREGYFPAPKLLAEKLNVKEGEVVEMEQRLSGSDVSIDAPLEQDSDSNLLSIMPSGSSSAEDILASKEAQKLLHESLNEFERTLNEKEKVIFRERMLSEEKVTLQDVAEKLSLSRERIRQVENRIMEKLKVFLKEKLGNSFGDMGA